MALSFNDFLKELAKTKPKKPVSKKFSADESDDFFDALNGIMSFRRWKDGGLTINPAVSTPKEARPFIDRNIKAFQQRLLRGEIRIAKGPDGNWLPAPADGEIIENQATRTNPCSWHWKLKYKWWGVRLGLNHCGTQWVADNALEAVSSFGLPTWVALALIEVAFWFKVFDTGCGVRIYITWAGIKWVRTRPHTVGIC